MSDAYVQIGEVARLADVSTNTIRSWERRNPGVLTIERTPGGHRRYPISFAFGIHQATHDEGLSGRSAITRGAQLSIEYVDPDVASQLEALVDRIAALEGKVVRLGETVAALNGLLRERRRA